MKKTAEYKRATGIIEDMDDAQLQRACDAVNRDDIMKEVRLMMNRMGKRGMKRAIEKEGSEQKVVQTLAAAAAKSLVIKTTLVSAGIAVAIATGVAGATTAGELASLGLDGIDPDWLDPDFIDHASNFISELFD